MTPSRPFLPLRAALLCGALIFSPTIAAAQATSDGIEAVSPRVLFVVSGGYWEADAEPVAEPEAGNGDAAAETPADPASPASVERGFYRLVVLRGQDNTSQVHLQRFALSPEGPKLVESSDLEAISSLPAYVTDARSEDTSNVSNQAGFAAFITLKTDPKVVERETWTVFVDEFGEVEVTRATN
jgi:hypothetical protein